MASSKKYFHRNYPDSFPITILFFLFLFFLPSLWEGSGMGLLHAQQSKADSLLSVINSANEDSNKVNALNLLAKEIVFTTGDYEKTLEYANQSIILAKQINYKKGQALALNIIGIAYMLQGNYPEAINNYEACLKIKEALGDKKGIASAYSNIGLVYMLQGDYSGALKFFKAALKMEEEIGDKAGIAGSYNNIGIIYKDLGNYPEALNNYLASLKIKEEIGDNKGIANTLNNIGEIKEFQGDYNKALLYHLYSLKIREKLEDKRGISDSYINIGSIYKQQGNYPEALKNYFISLKIFEETGNKSGIASTYSNIGLIYDVQGDIAYAKGNKNFALVEKYPEALKNYLASLKISTEIGDKAGIAASYILLGSVNIKLKKNSEAKKYLDNGLLVSKEIGNKIIIKDSYKELSVLDSLQGNIGKAYENYKMFVVYRDSLFNEENAEKSLQTQMQYEIEKDQLREAEEEKNRLKKIARRNTLQYLVILLFILLAVGAVMLLGFVKVPPALAQALNFVSLLLVFESVLVFTDPYMDTITQGIPIYKLGVNIVLAILIFPIHGFLERRLKKSKKMK